MNLSVLLQSFVRRASHSAPLMMETLIPRQSCLLSHRATPLIQPADCVRMSASSFVGISSISAAVIRPRFAGTHTNADKGVFHFFCTVKCVVINGGLLRNSHARGHWNALGWPLKPDTTWCWLFPTVHSIAANKDVKKADNGSTAEHSANRPRG